MASRNGLKIFNRTVVIGGLAALLGACSGAPMPGSETLSGANPLGGGANSLKDLPREAQLSKTDLLGIPQPANYSRQSRRRKAQCANVYEAMAVRLSHIAALEGKEGPVNLMNAGPGTDLRDMGGVQIALSAGRTAAESVLPFASVLPVVTGQRSRKDRRTEQVSAAREEVAFLTGYGQALNCPNLPAAVEEDVDAPVEDQDQRVQSKEERTQG